VNVYCYVLRLNRAPRKLTCWDLSLACAPQLHGPAPLSQVKARRLQRLFPIN
jgi:hypothetical protein